MSLLFDRQVEFAKLLPMLISKAYELGYLLTLGECYRTPEQAALNAQRGSGIPNSLHCLRLAVDLQLFLNGRYLTSTEDYKPLGEFWESLGGSWGGRFSKPDGNHFSLSFNGIR